MQPEKKKIFTGLKIMLIILLVMAIASVSVIQWKGDAIAEKAIRKLQVQLKDPLKYDAIHLEWFNHFPSVSLRLDGLKLGPDQQPLLEGGNVDIVLRLFPLFREKIVINRILISQSSLNIVRKNDQWSYEIFKKSEKASSDEWNTLVNKIELEESNLVYDDAEDIHLSLEIETATMKGELSGNNIDTDMNAKGIVLDFKNSSYTLPEPFSFDLSGNYKQDEKTGSREYNDWKIKNENVDIRFNGSTAKEKDGEHLEADISWDGQAEAMKPFIPPQNIKHWDEYTFSGNSKGVIKVNGKTNKNEILHLKCTATLKNGSIQFPGQPDPLTDITLDLDYDNGDPGSNKNSFAKINLKKGSMLGQSLRADINIHDLQNPRLDLDVDGKLPAGLLNLVSSSSDIEFQNGAFNIDHLRTKDLMMKNVSLRAFIEKSETNFSTNHVQFNYHDDAIEIHDGQIDLDLSGQMKMEADEFRWNKANAEDVKGTFEFIADQVNYEINGSLCNGEVESKGNITSLGQRPVMDADWKMKGVEIREVLASFENFGQAFITSENLNGRTDIWAHTQIPYDDAGNIVANHVLAWAAVYVKDGELKDMKILEDFSKYVHLEDLHDIRFNEFRNYIKVEAGKVYVPVVFIQSSAINMSVSGIHSFDQHILYDLKINAGQAAANKLRKLDPVKRFKAARKSGWINLYYVLSGTTSSVQYEQDQRKVISGFEQSAALKENLRTYLVDRFGYDVYWLEPNEWEDIPEYK
jgi:hypothetical protein